MLDGRLWKDVAARVQQADDDVLDERDVRFDDDDRRKLGDEPRQLSERARRMRLCIEPLQQSMTERTAHGLGEQNRNERLRNRQVAALPGVVDSASLNPLALPRCIRLFGEQRGRRHRRLGLRGLSPEVRVCRYDQAFERLERPIVEHFNFAILLDREFRSVQASGIGDRCADTKASVLRAVVEAQRRPLGAGVDELRRICALLRLSIFEPGRYRAGLFYEHERALVAPHGEQEKAHIVEHRRFCQPERLQLVDRVDRS